MRVTIENSPNEFAPLKDLYPGDYFENKAGLICVKIERLPGGQSKCFCFKTGAVYFLREEVRQIRPLEIKFLIA